MTIVSRLIRFGVLPTVLCVLVAFALVPAFAAAEDIDVEPGEGEIGDRIMVNGWFFHSGEEIHLYFSSDKADEGDSLDDLDAYERVKITLAGEDGEPDEGNIDTSFEVPDELTDGKAKEKVHGGTYYVYAIYEGEDEIVAVATFTVIAGEIQLDSDAGAVGTEVEITGEGFGGGKGIAVEYGGDELDIESGDEKTDSDGQFTCTIIIPGSTAGVHIITVTDESGLVAEAEFTVEPKITVTPAIGVEGDRISVKGTGFGNKADITIKFDGNEVAADETNEDGSFEVAVMVSAKSPGTYYLEAQDEDKNKHKVGFTVAAGIKLSNMTGNVGTEITISGTGFKPDSTLTVIYGTEPKVVATTTADTNGRFSAAFTVPKSKHGNNTITVTDGTNAVATMFAMESTPPPIPALLLPQIGAKAKSQAYFDWEDVGDPSGITYTLQIATNESFTDIVLKKTELTESENTLTKEERLKSTKPEAPYYWRVKAVDGASNESGWTTPGSFYVGFAFPTMPSWAMYTLFGFGALLLVVIGFWLSRCVKSQPENS